jgi:benzodiazapine receptor
MNKKTIFAYAAFIALSEAVGALAGILTRAGVREWAGVPKPALTPSGAVFPIVWTALYLLMGIGAARVYLSEGRGRKNALAIFAIQLAVNFLWSPIFFNLRAYALAFFWLALLSALVVLMTRAFLRADRPAGLLQIPYIAWSLFALYLSFAVWMLNR